MTKKRFLFSFRHAVAGIGYVFRTQPNFRLHLVAAAGAVGLGWFFKITPVEWLSLVLVIVLVIGSEFVNTALELTMDRISEHFHPLTKAAKDVAAGMVLISALGSIIIGAVIFIPRILNFFGAKR